MVTIVPDDPVMTKKQDATQVHAIERHG